MSLGLRLLLLVRWWRAVLELLMLRLHVMLVLRRLMISSLRIGGLLRAWPGSPHALVEGCGKSGPSGLAVVVPKFVPVKRTAGVISRWSWSAGWR